MMKSYYESKIGLIELAATEQGISGLIFAESAMVESTDHPLLNEGLRQLTAYFEEGRSQFDLPLDLQGTTFQQQVWQHLLTIPYGQTISYLDIARALNNEKAIRAVGQANGRNPVSIIVPCHRVIGHNGKLTGYGGGLWRKKWLLQHEQADLPLF